MCKIEPQNFILLFFLLIIGGCSNNSQIKKYSITTFFISSDKALNNVGKKFKYSYEEYNSDSNLIYQEEYSNPNNSNKMWGKLYEKEKFYYQNDLKIKSEKEFDIAYMQGANLKENKVVKTYEYRNGLLAKLFVGRKLNEEYKYNKYNEQIERRIINEFGIPEKYNFTYIDGLKIRTQYFVADTIFNTDTFIYDKNRRMCEQYSYNNRHEKISHHIIIRNSNGRIIEEKWREPYKGFRLHSNGQIIESEFYQANKYYYDNYGRKYKMEFYDLDKLLTTYEFDYD